MYSNGRIFNETCAKSYRNQKRDRREGVFRGIGPRPKVFRSRSLRERLSSTAAHPYSPSPDASGGRASSAGPIGSEDSNGLIERDTAAARPSDFLIHALYHLHHSPGVLIFLGMGVQAEAVTFHLFDSFALFSLHPLHWTGVAMAERPML